VDVWWLGVDATAILSRFLGTAGTRLIRLVVRAQEVTSKPTFKEVVELSEFGPIRQWRAIVSEARKGKFAKNVGYTGWSKRALFRAGLVRREDRKDGGESAR
jgi:hypothetical protein